MRDDNMRKELKERLDMICESIYHDLTAYGFKSINQPDDTYQFIVREDYKVNMFCCNEFVCIYDMLELKTKTDLQIRQDIYMMIQINNEYRGKYISGFCPMCRY